MVRGLALRALASLRQKALVEHVILPLKSGLVDVSPYVRRTAVLGCAKVFQLAPDTIKGKSPPLPNTVHVPLT
jgi:AP-4 complex subunit beta-1